MKIERTITIERRWDGSAVPPDDHIQLTLKWDGVRELTVHFVAPFYGDPPPDELAGSPWGLWAYEVVELFLVGDHGHYLELEFGPHGHHLGLLLGGPRSITHRHLPLKYDATVSGPRWTGHARLSGQYVPTNPSAYNAFAIRGTGQNRDYLAAHPLPGDVPDFHQPTRFPLL